MDYKELKQAAKVFNRINSIRNYVSKDRFAAVASTKFNIEDEREIDIMYGLLNMTPHLVYYIANDTKEFRRVTRFPAYMELMPKAIEIAESAYSLKPNGWGGNDVPYIRHDAYRKEDRRRYFYWEGEDSKVLDVSMGSREDIITLSELLQRDGVKLCGVAEHLGCLEGKMKGNTREKFQYYDGDIYFLFGDPTDRVFYDWISKGGNAGVYMATDKGWRKLLYTPGRGYVDKKGEPDYVDDKHFFSDYMLEQSGMGFKYVGNVRYDWKVLAERKEQKKEDEE